MRVRIRVTKSDIEQGLKTSSDQCPIARAASHSLPEHSIEVYDRAMFIRKKEITYPRMRPREQVIQLPRKATKFIDAFDNGESVEPFAFTIEVLS